MMRLRMCRRGGLKSLRNELMVVKIPNISEEVRIGSSFNYLMKVIKETDANDGSVVWDFDSVSFLHPFFLAPLAIYKVTSKKKISCTNISLKMQSYLNNIYFDRMLHFESDAREDIEDVMSKYEDRTYTPLCSFAMTDANKDTFGSIIRGIITKQTSIDAHGITPMSYFISELLDNIYEHSLSQNGYIFSQYLKREGYINLCIADAGITIYKSFERAGLYQQEIDNDESISLRLANEGYSTKNRPEAENRGYGISTSKRMLVEGLGGSFFMLSGGAFHRYEKKKENYYVNIRHIFNWPGTVILLRIPVRVPSGFNYMDYLE